VIAAAINLKGEWLKSAIMGEPLPGRSVGRSFRQGLFDTIAQAPSEYSIQDRRTATPIA
jgi:hypothetical protein